MSWRKLWKPRLPEEALSGSFTFSEAALRECERLLPTYRGVDGDHEGIAFLLGRMYLERTFYLTAVAPKATHAAGSVRCSHSQVGEVVALARRLRLALLAQAHTHPTGIVEHSEGDDEMIVMPFEGMLSFVVPHYGKFGMRPIDSLGVHQYQGGRWVRCASQSVVAQIQIAPSAVDLR